jgi:multidrug efflux pump subunit AcrB
VSYEFDQSPYVTRAISGLTLEGALGALLTGLMILLFLRDWRSALIVVVNIPLSLMTALLVLWVTKQTINIMTLGGLALAVGILVDEATVCIENIHAHLARGQALARAVFDATIETTGPRFLAMLCILAMFTPALFMVGAAKAMFIPLSLAVGFSMMASYLLSGTLVPILSNWMLRGHPHRAAAQGHTESRFARFQKQYATWARRAVRWRWALAGAYLAGAGAVILLLAINVGTEIFPAVESGQLQVRMRALPGTHIDGTEALALKALELIKQEVGPENVEITLAFLGVHAPSYPINLIYLFNGGPEEGVLQVQLKSGVPVQIRELQERLRAKFAAELPEVSFSFEPSDIVNRVMSLGSPTPIEVAIGGPNLAANREFAQKIKERLQQLTVLRDLRFGQTLDYPTVAVTADRQKAGLMGVRMTEVSRALVTATSSSRFVVPNYWADPNSGVAYQVQVQVPQTQMDSLEQARNVPVMDHNGHGLLLRNVAQIAEGTAVGQYQRYNMQRLVTVTANIAGADLGSASRKLTGTLKELGRPPAGVTVTVRGQMVPLEQMIDGLRVGLLMAVIVICLLLTANFQSLRLSLLVVSTTPAVVAGVLIMLRLTGTTLNIQSFMGAIMAIGVAVANAILLVTFAERSRMAGASADEAAVEGATTRLRPILMTSMAMIAGMVPMAIGLGESGQQAAPLGRAVIGGLALATLATLLILPAIFAIVQGRAHRGSVSLHPDDILNTGGDQAAEG